MKHLTAKLLALAKSWEESAVKRREDADAETDKVWSARQYGLADTMEDAATQIRSAISELGSALPDLGKLIMQWTELAEQALALAESDDNRLTVAYRRAGHEAYMKAVEALRELTES